MKKSKKKLLALGIQEDLVDKIIDLGYTKSSLKNLPKKKLKDIFTENETDIIYEKVRRKAIPPETIDRMIEEYDWKCPICYDIKKVHPLIVHHITQYSESQNNDFDNLILLCLEHHEDAHTKSTLSGDFLPENVLKVKRNEWLEYVRSFKRLHQMERTAIIHYSKNLAQISEGQIREDFPTINFTRFIEISTDRPLLNDLSYWEQLKLQQKEIIDQILKDSEIKKFFFVFSIHRIPLIIHLGFLFGDGYSIELFNFKLSGNTWRWYGLPESEEKHKIQIDDSKIVLPNNSNEFLLVIELSGVTEDGDFISHLQNPSGILRIRAEYPSITWLKYKEQIINFKEILYDSFAQIQRQNPNAKKLHIFYAGPPPPAFILGQVIKRLYTNYSEFVIYNFDSKNQPRYTRIFII